MSYLASALITDVRKLVSDADGVLDSTADLLPLITLRQNEWWTKFVERPELLSLGTLTTADLEVEFTVAPLAPPSANPNVCKMHAVVWAEGSDPAGAGEYPIIPYQKAKYRRISGSDDVGSYPDSFGLEVVSRSPTTTDEMVVRLCACPAVAGTVWLKATLFPEALALTNNLSVDEASARTIMRLVAYDAATLLGRGPETIQMILQPVEVNTLAAFGLEVALQSAKKAAGARA